MLASDVTIKRLAEQGHVQRVLAGWTGPEMDFNAVFQRGAAQSPKVRAFVDFLVDPLRFDVDYMHELCPDKKACSASKAMASIGSGTIETHAPLPRVVQKPMQASEEEALVESA
jgi:hypothetical protein